MTAHKPLVVVIAGPNGAGKSTSAPRLLRDTLEVKEFVNADAIASGLSAFNPAEVAIQAGRLMLSRIKALAESKEDFAFETTLASRSFAPWLSKLGRDGYSVHIAFLALPTPELAVARVAGRVSLGGHAIPEPVIRRRYRRGLVNFFNLYQPIASTWEFSNNIEASGPQLVARKDDRGHTMVFDEESWSHFREFST